MDEDDQGKIEDEYRNYIFYKYHPHTKYGPSGPYIDPITEQGMTKGDIYQLAPGDDSSGDDSSGDDEQSGGNYYHKYLKYKNKYLKIKNNST